VTLTRVVLILLLATLSGAAVADDRLTVRPDPQLTPGAVRTSDTSEICAPGYAHAHRVWPYPAGKRQVLAAYSIAWADRAGYEDDDLVPVCLGGDNADIRNHWPEWVDQAEVKDEIEAEMCRNVCAGEIGIGQAQRYFLDLDRAVDGSGRHESR
jgi:hypothetical protein